MCQPDQAWSACGPTQPSDRLELQRLLLKTATISTGIKGRFRRTPGFQNGGSVRLRAAIPIVGGLRRAAALQG